MFGFSRDQKVILHLTWIAFFLTFFAWFNMAPFNTTLEAVLGLTPEQIKILMICNVALTIPARILIGSLVDHFGPKKVFVWLLVFASLICFQFSFANSFKELIVSRLLMGIVGAGFVVGIKMIGEWFPPDKMGTAQGLYGGWGVFGAAAAAIFLPQAANFFPPDSGWRIATGFSGFLCLLWALVYFKFAKETQAQPANNLTWWNNFLKVTSKKDIILQILLMVPLYLALMIFVWKMAGHPFNLLSTSASWILGSVIFLLFCFQSFRSIKKNLAGLEKEISPEAHYELRQIFILGLVYSLTFGGELAVISMFPEFLETTFGLSVTTAGLLGSSFAFFNLVTRPSGGWLSDLLGRRRVLVILVLGTIIFFWFMGKIDSQWSLPLTIGLAVLCSAFLQAGNGVCFSMVPLIRKDLTGKFAGLAGAYGNAGAVYFLTVLSFVNEQTFFKVIGGYAVFVLLSLVFLKSFKNLHPSYH